MSPTTTARTTDEARSSDSDGEGAIDVVVVAASAGGVEPLRELVRGLRPDLPACVLVVLHVPPIGNSALPIILSRAGPLPARHARHGEHLRTSTVLIAPPDHHLLIDDSHAAVIRGPRENGLRPAADPLFRTAARWFGPRALGVVLSGSLDDGSAGLVSIVRHGGVALVQDPDDAIAPSMPRSALALVPTAEVAPAAELAAMINKLVDGTAVAAAAGGSSHPAPVDLAEVAMEPEGGPVPDPRAAAVGRLAVSCPDCSGVLSEIDEGGLVRFKCLVGHVWSADSLLASQSQELEGALWVALRSLEEKVLVARRLQGPALERGSVRAAEGYEETAAEAAAAARVIRDLLTSTRGDEPARSA